MPICTSVCDFEPFNSVVTPESSDVEILRTEIEDYLRRLRDAICSDFQCVKTVVDHSLDAFDVAASVTSIEWAMGRLTVGVLGSNVNPGFPRASVTDSVFVELRVGANTVAGDWTLRLRKNEETTDSATFTMEAGLAGVHQKSFGAWSTQVTFAAGETYHLVADGPEKNAVLARAILRFEEV